MSTIEILLDEVKQAPPAMLDEVFDRPRTLSDLADEQRAFLASLSQPLVDIDLPCEE